MSITKELRELPTFGGMTIEGEGYDLPRELVCVLKHDLLAIADRIDAEHEKAIASVMNDALYHANEKDMAELGWTRLPVDADGEYIRVGDKLDGYGKTIEVVELRYGRSGWVLISRDGNAYADTFAFTHHHAPTVEDVLREFAERYLDYEGVPSAGRRGIGEALMDEYAAKLRLREDA